MISLKLSPNLRKSENESVVGAVNEGDANEVGAAHDNWNDEMQRNKMIKLLASI